MKLSFLFTAAILLAGTSGAWAQTGRNFNVETMNFDLWCQEQAHLPVDRCDKRTPEDEAVFEAFRNKVERYEIPYLVQKNNEIILDRTLRNDPVDSPLRDDPGAQSPNPNQPPHNPPP